MRRQAINSLHHSRRLDAGKPLVQSLIGEDVKRSWSMPKQMQNRRIQIADVHGVFDNVVAIVVRLAMYS